MRHEQGVMMGERRTGGESGEDQSLRKDWMKQFRKRIDAFDVDTVKIVSRRLVGGFDLAINGYGDQSRDNLIHQTESEKELGKILESWIKGGIRGLFVVGVKEKVDFMRKLEKTGQEIETMKSDFIKSTGINLSVSNIGTDQYRGVISATKFAEAEESLYLPDSILESPGTYVQNNSYQRNYDVLKESKRLHLDGKSEEYSMAFKATYEWLLCDVSDDGVASEREKIRYLSGLVEKVGQEGNYNPMPNIRWSAIKKV